MSYVISGMWHVIAVEVIQVRQFYPFVSSDVMDFCLHPATVRSKRRVKILQKISEQWDGTRMLIAVIVVFPESSQPSSLSSIS